MLPSHLEHSCSITLPLRADLTGELLCMQEVHRNFRCMAYDEAELRLIIVGDNGQAGKASSSQQLASALSVSIWDVSSMLRPVMSSLCGTRQVHLQSNGHSNACSAKTTPHIVADPVFPGLGCNCLCVMSTVASLSCIVPSDPQNCSAFLDMPEAGNPQTSLILVDYLMREFAVHVVFSSGGPKEGGTCIGCQLLTWLFCGLQQEAPACSKHIS